MQHKSHTKVYTPPESFGADLPVMVWLYGGGFKQVIFTLGSLLILPRDGGVFHFTGEITQWPLVSLIG